MGTRVRIRRVASIPRVWRGLEGVVDFVLPGVPDRYHVVLDETAGAPKMRQFETFIEDELEVIDQP